MHSTRTALHAALTAIMAGLAYSFARPEAMFASNPNFGVFRTLGSEDAWTVALILVVAIGAAGVVVQNRLVRLASVLVLSTMHGVIAVCFMLAPQWTTGTITYAVVASLGYYLAWRRADEGL